MSDIAIFVFGLVSSVHCLAMCGGIFAASQDRRSRVLYYNAGRLVSYTAAGAAAGALGSLASVSDGLRAFVAVVGGCLVAAIGCTMLGRFPALKALFTGSSEVLSRSSPHRRQGGIHDRTPHRASALRSSADYAPCSHSSRFGLEGSDNDAPLRHRHIARPDRSRGRLFEAGLKRAVVAAGHECGRRSRHRDGSGHGVQGPCTIRSASAGGHHFFLRCADREGTSSGRIDSAERWRSATRRHEDREHGLPSHRGAEGSSVAWTISARPEDLNEHSSTFSIPDLGVKKTLSAGDTLVEFTPPDRSGEMEYCSWCAMISSRIYVVDDLNEVKADIGNRAARAEKDAAE